MLAKHECRKAMSKNWAVKERPPPKKKTKKKNAISAISKLVDTICIFITF